MATSNLGFLGAAERVLAEAGEPLHYGEITHRALANGWVVTAGKTPEATMNAQIATQLKRHTDDSTFVRVRPGVFGLRRWLEEGRLETAAIKTAGRPLVPHYPLYARVRDVLPVWDGGPRGAITGMQAAIWEHRGTPQSQTDWSDPDEWIAERLDGEAREWARRTWQDTGKRVSPRYVTGHWLVASNFRLLEPDASERLALTERGRDFLAHHAGAVVREIDEDQGLLFILQLVAEAGAASPADLYDSWLEFLRAETNVRAESAAKSHLSARLRNLAHREYVERTGRTYSVTRAGLEYLQQAGLEVGAGEAEDGPMRQILRLQEEMREGVRDGLRDLLLDIDPFAFEHVVQQLLDAMGYVDTEVTSAANDKGVDVIGMIKVGITEVREVVQVKRLRSNVQRPVLDQLRGSLHRFDAVRGTIICTSGFSKGTRDAAFERGAAPITLIDGETLIQLLIDHGIGVSKRKLELWELDADALSVELDEAADGLDGETAADKARPG